jgi:hypothetical protein
VTETELSVTVAVAASTNHHSFGSDTGFGGRSCIDAGRSRGFSRSNSMRKMQYGSSLLFYNAAAIAWHHRVKIPVRARI